MIELENLKEELSSILLVLLLKQFWKSTDLHNLNLTAKISILRFLMNFIYIFKNKTVIVEQSTGHQLSIPREYSMEHWLSMPEVDFINTSAHCILVSELPTGTQSIQTLDGTMLSLSREESGKDQLQCVMALMVSPGGWCRVICLHAPLLCCIWRTWTLPSEDRHNSGFGQVPSNPHNISRDKRTFIGNKTGKDIPIQVDKPGTGYVGSFVVVVVYIC